MGSNDELKEIGIKNVRCYYFNIIIKIEDFNLNNVLIDKKFESILPYNISYKNLIGKPLSARFNKTVGFIRVFDGTRYLELSGSKKYDSIYSKIRYLTSVKNDIT